MVVDPLKLLTKVLSPAFRTKQAIQAIFHNLISSWDEATVLPKDIRERLQEEFPLEIASQILEAEDRQSAKAVIRLADDAVVETVLMRHPGGRNTVCVSSQVGCALDCSFCATGKLDFKRNLSAWEIAEQVLLFARLLKKTGQRVTNVVFMGMGEPFLNYNEVISAVHLLNDRDKFGLGARSISISTVGIPAGIKKMAGEKLQINLAVSLHAPNDALRSRIMEINKKYPLAQVLKVTSEYISATNRRVMVEYLMLDKINDSEENAKELAAVLKQYLKRLFFVNLIVYNPTGDFKPALPRQVARFKKILEGEGITVTERYRFGQDITGACGQLASKSP